MKEKLAKYFVLSKYTKKRALLILIVTAVIDSGVRLILGLTILKDLDKYLNQHTNDSDLYVTTLFLGLKILLAIHAVCLLIFLYDWRKGIGTGKERFILYGLSFLIYITWAYLQ